MSEYRPYSTLDMIKHMSKIKEANCQAVRNDALTLHVPFEEDEDLKKLIAEAIFGSTGASVEERTVQITPLGASALTAATIAASFDHSGVAKVLPLHSKTSKDAILAYHEADIKADEVLRQTMPRMPHPTFPSLVVGLTEDQPTSFQESLKKALAGPLENVEFKLMSARDKQKAATLDFETFFNEVKPPKLKKTKAANNPWYNKHRK